MINFHMSGLGKLYGNGLREGESPYICWDGRGRILNCDPAVHLIVLTSLSIRYCLSHTHRPPSFSISTPVDDDENIKLGFGIK